MKKIKIQFEFEVTDENALRGHFAKSFIPPSDAVDCHVGYFGVCMVEDGFHGVPGVELREETLDYE